MVVRYFELMLLLLLQLQNYCCSCSTTAAAAVLLLKLQYCCCSCTTFSRHKTKLNNCIPNLSIFCFYQPGLTSITAAAAAAVEAPF